MHGGEWEKVLMVTGADHALGEALVDHRETKAIAFTGSEASSSDQVSGGVRESIRRADGCPHGHMSMTPGVVLAIKCKLSIVVHLEDADIALDAAFQAYGWPKSRHSFSNVLEIQVAQMHRGPFPATTGPHLANHISSSIGQPACF